MINVLITGANGQLGNEIQALAGQYPFHFFGIDIDTLDLTDKQAVEDYLNKGAIDFDYLINCAAYTAVDRAEDEEEMARKINVEAVRNLAEASRGRTRIIHVSTDYVFPGNNPEALKETDPTDPQSVYGRTKLEGEQVLQTLCPESIIVRTAWLYSTYGNNFVKTMLRLGKEKESINVVADQFGTPTYAGDLAQAILDIIRLAEEQGTFPAGIYHYSNEGRISWYDFAVRIMQQAKLPCQVNPVPSSEYPTRAQRPAFSVLDKTKIKETFQLEIPAWETSLDKCINLLQCPN